MDRPTKYTPELTKRIRQYISDGLTVRDACYGVGISEDTFCRIKMTKGDFLNLLATSAEKLKNGTFAEKDAIARIWFLNLRIGDKKEVSCLCKTEIKDLVKFGNVISGGSGRT